MSDPIAAQPLEDKHPTRTTVAVDIQEEAEEGGPSRRHICQLTPHGVVVMILTEGEGEGATVEEPLSVLVEGGWAYPVGHACALSSASQLAGIFMDGGKSCIGVIPWSWGGGHICDYDVMDEWALGAQEESRRLNVSWWEARVDTLMISCSSNL